MADRNSDKAAGMKSAYELALERLERQGIEPPREGSVSEETRQRMAEVRQQVQAKLAELEILHRDRLKGLYDPDKRREEEEEYVRERRRLEADRDRKLEKLRGG
jgi:DNA helicase IV